MRSTMNGSISRRHVFAELSSAAIFGLFSFQGTIEAENRFRSREKRTCMEVSRKANLHHGAKRFLLNVGYAMGRPFSARFKARMMNVFCKHAFSG